MFLCTTQILTDEMDKLTVFIHFNVLQLVTKYRNICTATQAAKVIIIIK